MLYLCYASGDRPRPPWTAARLCARTSEERFYTPPPPPPPPPPPRGFCLNSSSVAVSKITSRRWSCIESLFPGPASRRTPSRGQPRSCAARGARAPPSRQRGHPPELLCFICLCALCVRFIVIVLLVQGVICVCCLVCYCYHLPEAGRRAPGAPRAPVGSQ